MTLTTVANRTMYSENNKPVAKNKPMGEQPVSVESAPEKRSCGVVPLDVILSKVEPIDWKPVRNSDGEKDYIIRSRSRPFYFRL